jgi:hypothetical protein
MGFLRKWATPPGFLSFTPSVLNAPTRGPRVMRADRTKSPAADTGVYMKTISMMVVAMAVLGVVACGDDPDKVCDDAENILNGCTEGLELSFKECSDETQAFAQCVVDYPDAACGEDTTDNDDYDHCVYESQH